MITLFVILFLIFAYISMRVTLIFIKDIFNSVKGKANRNRRL